MPNNKLVWVGKSNRVIEVVNRHITHCEDFSEFVNYFMKISTPDQLPNYVSLSVTDVFDNSTLNPIEYINCYTNFIKLVNNRFGNILNPVNVGIRVGEKLVPVKHVELLQNTDIAGIGPMQIVYGKDAVLESFNNRDKYGAYWPSYLIDTKASADNEYIVLTGREQVVLDLISNRAATNKQIAKYLGISESAVKFHVGNILKKYALKNRTQLVALRKLVK